MLLNLGQSKMLINWWLWKADYESSKRIDEKNSLQRPASINSKWSHAVHLMKLIHPQKNYSVLKSFMEI